MVNYVIKSCFFFRVVCRDLVSGAHGARGRPPLQKLPLASRSIHHSHCPVPMFQKLPLWTSVQQFSTLNHLPLQSSKLLLVKYRSQPHRNFWLARVASRLLRLRYIILGSAVGGGYTAKKVLESAVAAVSFNLSVVLSEIHSLVISRTKDLRMEGIMLVARVSWYDGVLSLPA